MCQKESLLQIATVIRTELKVSFKFYKTHVTISVVVNTFKRDCYMFDIVPCLKNKLNRQINTTILW